MDEIKTKPARAARVTVRFPGSKVYYSIREVAGMTSLKPYVLRFWESEFPQLHPKLSRGGRRQYQQDDIKLILMIKRLLYEDGFTIAGARVRLNEIREQDPDQIEIQFNQFREKFEITEIIKELKDILTSLR
jgi:DNA-binding transcriptional MerR regulator